MLAKAELLVCAPEGASICQLPGSDLLKNLSLRSEDKQQVLL